MRIAKSEPLTSIPAQPNSSTLVLAAHADDAILGIGGWVCEQPGAIAVAVLTDGTPGDLRFFTDGSRDPSRYRLRRRQEAERVWSRHCPKAKLFFAAIADQRLAFSLAPAAAWLEPIIAITRPTLMLTPAFEGGHPDHDAANLLVARLARRHNLPVWEYALYGSWCGGILRQRFPGGLHLRRITSPRLLRRKRRALAGYISQREVLRDFDPAIESLRPLPHHDYRRPPRPGPLVYERWGFPLNAEEVAAAFATWLDRFSIAAAVKRDEDLLACAS